MSVNGQSMGKRNENNINGYPESLLLKRNKPERPQRLRIKTKQFYDVKLPTYEESQEKYEKFLYTLKEADEKKRNKTSELRNELLNTVK